MTKYERSKIRNVLGTKQKNPISCQQLITVPANLYYLSWFSMIPSLQRITWFECRSPKHLCVVHYGKQTWFRSSKSSLL
jgi:hypothetical protein